MSWTKYSYVRLTVRLEGGKNDVKTYRFDDQKDVEEFEKDINTLLPLMKKVIAGEADE